MSYENWVCPHCSHAQAFTPSRFDRNGRKFNVKGSKFIDPGIVSTVFVCANENCKKISLEVQFGRVEYIRDDGAIVGYIADPIHSWSLIPGSSAKPQPDCIPPPLVADYNEACAIRHLSPKASATLSRRCLQGMIRDFCGISKGTLVQEITELRGRVDDGRAPAGVQLDTLDAIDAVRKVGNIGAHMEKDINIIVDVDPGEAQALITLIEMLFEDWYIQRHKRQQRLAAVQELAASKEAAKKLLPSPEAE